MKKIQKAGTALQQLLTVSGIKVLAFQAAVLFTKMSI
jgi:hypothetical protein